LVVLTLALASCSGDGGEPTAAQWGLAPDSVLAADTTTFDVLVHEGACSSGRSAAGRIAPPKIDYGDEAVHIEFAVHALPGSQTCPGPPPTRYTVRLREPLGDRELTGDVDVDPQCIESPLPSPTTICR
jgi:hypothetical protein